MDDAAKFLTDRVMDAANRNSDWVVQGSGVQWTSRGSDHLDTCTFKDGGPLVFVHRGAVLDSVEIGHAQ